jgi:hypothetical protein
LKKNNDSSPSIPSYCGAVAIINTPRSVSRGSITSSHLTTPAQSTKPSASPSVSGKLATISAAIASAFEKVLLKII